MAISRPEEPVHKACLAAGRLLYPAGIWFHIPNQRFGKNLRFILAKLGVLAGMPDLGCLRPWGRIGWVEVKKPGELKKKGKGLTDSQEKLHPRMAALWHHVHLVDGAEQMQPITDAWRREDAATEKALGDAA